MVNILRKLVYSHKIVNWTSSFLNQRKVHLHFNGILLEQHNQPVGVPQGSPLSSVLSITYTSFLLHKMVEWNNSSLGMYMDDIILFACPPNWEGVTMLLCARYTVCHRCVYFTLFFCILFRFIWWSMSVQDLIIRCDKMVSHVLPPRAQLNHMKYHMTLRSYYHV